VTVVAPLPSVDTFVTGLVDYAGLFPPASLDMASAVHNYRAYRSEPQARMLGRFVVPVGRLTEFFAAASVVLPQRRTDPPWRLAVLCGADLAGDLQRVVAFNTAHADAATGRAIIDVLEVKAGTPAEVDALRAAIPAGFDLFVEIPVASDPTVLLDALRDHGARAKVRTGGVTPDAIPPSADVARFLVAAARARVAFKATAGLHHALRGRHALTYAPDSVEAVMHGFVNVFASAALAYAGASIDDIVAGLEETDATAFRFGPTGLRWRGRQITLADLHQVRAQFALSFGSCSFQEPLQDLQSWGLV
jgi:hypothetical protein